MTLGLLPGGREIDASSPEACARSFIAAIEWGAHLWVWELMSESGRHAALAVAERNGLDRVAAARARAATWTPAEADDLLTALVHGLRIDLSRVEISAIVVAGASAAQPDGTRRVRLATPAPFGDGWPAGVVTVSPAGASWQVDRLEPRAVE